MIKIYRERSIKNVFYFIAFIAMAGLCSCSPVGNGKEPVEATVGDTLYKYQYYPDGQLMRATPYVNGLINGQMKFYYDNGVLKSKLRFVNSLPHGWGYNYDKAGELEKKEFYKKGLPFGLSLTYSGGRLKEYRARKGHTTDFFVRMYDENGSIRQDSGDKSPVILVSINKEELKDSFFRADDHFALEVLFINPPEFIISSEVKLEHNGEVISAEHVNIPSQPFIYEYQNEFATPGNLKLTVSAAIKDTLRNTIEKHTVAHTFQIKP